MNGIKWIVFCFLGSILAGCGAGISGYSKKLSGGFYFHRPDSSNRFISEMAWTPGESIVIPNTVLDYTFDDDFILAKQREAYFEHFTINYWIIDVRLPKLYGPFKTKDEFDFKMSELGVSEGLALE